MKFPKFSVLLIIKTLLWVAPVFLLLFLVFQPDDNKFKVINGLFFLAHFSILVFWTLKVRLSLWFVALLWGTLYFASYTKLILLNEVVGAIDWFAFKNLVSDFSILHIYGLTGYIVGAFIVLSVVFYGITLILIPKQKSKLKLVLARMFSCFFVLLTFKILNPYFNHQFGDFVKSFPPRGVFERCGPLAYFLVSIANYEMTIITPKFGESSDYFFSALAKAEPQVHGVNGLLNGNLPDIWIWLNESVFDPSLVKGLEKAPFNTYMFEPSVLDISRGFLRVHTLGGATWISETGLTAGLNPENEFGRMAFFSHYTIAHQLKNSLFRELERIGYSQFLFYPVPSKFFGGKNAYFHYGIKNFIEPSDLGLRIKSYQVADAEDDVMNDLLWANRMLERYRNFKTMNPTTPLVLYVVTMRNHGPHSGSNVPKGNPLATFVPDFKIDQNHLMGLRDYLWRIDNTSEAHRLLDESMKEFGKTGKKIMFLSFGDHQPALDGLYNFLPYKIDNRGWSVTYYSLKANFLKSKFSTLRYPELDITLLPGLMLDLIGKNESEFFKANSKMRRSCNGKFYFCEDNNLTQSFRYHLHKDLGTLK